METIKTTLRIQSVEGAGLMTFFLQLVVTGLAQGMVYALVAIGFVIILKCSEVFNIAQGHFVMIGGYLGYTFLVTFGLPIWAALGLAIVTAIIMGLLIERLILRPLLGEPVLAVIMVTIALATILGGLATLLWGAEYKAYHGLLPTITLKIGEISVPSESLIGLIVSVACVVALMLLFRYTKIGLAMRATAEDLQVVQSVGIKANNRLCRLMDHRLCCRCHRRHPFGGRIRREYGSRQCRPQGIRSGAAGGRELHWRLHCSRNNTGDAGKRRCRVPGPPPARRWTGSGIPLYCDDHRAHFQAARAFRPGQDREDLTNGFKHGRLPGKLCTGYGYLPLHAPMGRGGCPYHLSFRLPALFQR